MNTGVMIAFYIPETVASILHTQAVAAGLSATPVADMHLTLCRLGEAADLQDRKDSVLAHLKEFATLWEPIEGKIGGIGRFNPSEGSDGKSPIYASVDCVQLGEVRESVARFMRWAGTPISASHGFTPHITLSYIAADQTTPDVKIETSAVRFETVSVVWGDERHDFPLGFTEIVVDSQMRADEHFEPLLRISETRETDGRIKARLDFISELKGTEGVDYPIIAVPDDVNLSELNKIYNDDPVFVTLPIGQFNARSRNGRRYTKQAMESMCRQINEHRNEGMRGHLADYEMGTRYDEPEIFWLASAIQKDKVYGKLIAVTEGSRLYYKVSKAVNKIVGTSLFAWATMDGDDVIDLELITIDRADPARVGVLMTAAKPFVTNEMSGDTPTPPVTELSENPNSEVQDEIMGNQPQVPVPTPGMVTGLESELREQRIRDNNTIADLRKQISDMTPDADAMKAIREKLNLSEDKPVLASVIEMANVVTDLVNLLNVKELGALRAAVRLVQTERDDMASENTKLLDSSVTALVEQRVKVADTRGIITDMIKAYKPRTADELKEYAERVFALETVKSIMKIGVAAEMGNPQTPPQDSRPPEAPNGAGRPSSFLQPKPE